MVCFVKESHQGCLKDWELEMEEEEGKWGSRS